MKTQRFREGKCLACLVLQGILNPVSMDTFLTTRFFFPQRGITNRSYYAPLLMAEPLSTRWLFEGRFFLFFFFGDVSLRTRLRKSEEGGDVGQIL